MGTVPLHSSGAASALPALCLGRMLGDVNPQTGQGSYRPETFPQRGVELEFCPNFRGVRTWMASAYHPEGMRIPLRKVPGRPVVGMPANVLPAAFTATCPPVRWTETRTKPSSGVADVSSVEAFRSLVAAIHVTVGSCAT